MLIYRMILFLPNYIIAQLSHIHALCLINVCFIKLQFSFNNIVFLLNCLHFGGFIIMLRHTIPYTITLYYILSCFTFDSIIWCSLYRMYVISHILYYILYFTISDAILYYIVFCIVSQSVLYYILFCIVLHPLLCCIVVYRIILFCMIW